MAEGFADTNGVTAELNLSVQVDLADQVIGLVSDGWKGGGERAWGWLVVGSGGEELQSFMGTQVIIDLPPVIEGRLAFL
jgi:hypothetical protein